MSAASYSWNNSTNGDPGGWFTDKAPQVNQGSVSRARYIDLTQSTAAISTAYKVMNIPAGALVTRVQVIPTASENTGLTVGDSGAATTFLSTTSASMSAGGVQTAYSTGKFYAAADEVQMTWISAASNFKGYITLSYHMLTTASD